MKQTIAIVGNLIIILALFVLPAQTYAISCNPGTGSYSTATDGSCAFAGMLNGAGGVLTVAAGTQLTVTPGQTIGATSIVIQTGGVVILPTDGTGSMKPGASIWYGDADGDGYLADTSPSYVQAGSPGATYYAKNDAHILSLTQPDCYDVGTNADKAHPGQTEYQSQKRGDDSWDYDCDGIETRQYQTCNCETCVEGCSSSPTCTYPTVTPPTSYTCGVAMVPGPGSCSRVNDGYGTCTECNNGADGSYTVLCK
jgi:hypothetical protein